MTEDQAERAMDRLDRAFMAGRYTQAQYDAKVRAMDARVKISAAPLTLLNGQTTQTTWADFCRDNADCLSAADLDDIATTLAAGNAYHGGGGAEPAWMLTIR